MNIFNVATYSAFMELIKKKTLKELSWHLRLGARNYGLCSISGARSLVYLHDLNFYDVICFVVRAKKSGFGFFWVELVLFLWHLTGISNRF